MDSLQLLTLYLALTPIFSVVGLTLAARNTKLCFHCDHIEDPSQCTTYQACHLHDHSCSTEVHLENGKNVYTLGCKPNHECRDAAANTIVGKRAPGPDEHHAPHGDPHHVHGPVQCRQCCTTTGCNANLCGSFMAPNTTTAPMAIASAGGCRDIEDANFNCSDYDKYELCSVSDAGFAYEIGHVRCQKHCGFCDPNGPLLDLSKTPMPTAAMKDTTVMQDTTAMPDTTMFVPIGAEVSVNQMQTTQQSVCRDFEDANFSCANWAMQNNCLASAGQGFDIAKLRCSKTCGFCQ